MKQQIPVSKNDTVTLDISGLTHDGEGVGRYEGFTLFVHGALPGEQVQAKVLKVKKTYGYAKLLDVLVPSPERVQPACEWFARCGGCQLQHLSYPAQLAEKRRQVVNNLVRLGGLVVQGENGSDEHTGVIVHPTLGMDNEEWRYRNKSAVPFGVDAAGQLIGGFYARGSHRIVDMNRCLIQHPYADDVVQLVKTIAHELRIAPYDENTGRGVLRHVVTRVGVATDETMIVLVTNSKKLPQREEWIRRIRAAVPSVRSIVHNVNMVSTNVIFGDETNVVWGSEYIYDELDGLRFAISARSFYQVNPVQTVTLYRKALEYAALTGQEKVIDAYCGIGTISLFLARAAEHVYGVEIVPEAIQDAQRNAALNDLTNATFETGAAEVVIPRWREEGVTADVIVVDPPRKGCDEALLATIVAMQPKRVVYVSCNPATLARDLRVLEDGGYRAVEVQPVDMFPHTGHVEAVVKLVRT